MQSWISPSVPHVPGDPLPLRLYDTATGSLRPVAPGPTARMFVCGITPYDATHLGHAATYLTYDLVVRQWLDAGHHVEYVQNVTDIDDPLLERAEHTGEDWQALAERETALFRSDMAALRVIAPQHFVGAVEAIDEITTVVQGLLDRGAAYRADDPEFPDVYFDHTATGRFGYESGYTLAQMNEVFGERGGDPERKGKRHELDALVWRMARQGEPCWSSQLGNGRPGWHVECSAIALNRLGMAFDVQGGGSDLAFPHHEFSAAHAEALRAEHPFARLYSHAAMIGLDGEKMSKSKGNLVLVSSLREQGTDPGVIRLGLFAGSYRHDRSWTEATHSEAVARLARWRAAVQRPVGPAAEDTVRALREHLADDLDTPRALAAIDAWVSESERREGTDPQAPDLITTAVDGLLGIRL